MDKINQFFKQHGSKVITILLIFLYFKSCGVDKDVNKLKREVNLTYNETIQSQEDALILIKNLIEDLPTKTDISIEGLKSEKRMIQATNRKMLDVERQNEIEKEIKILEKR